MRNIRPSSVAFVAVLACAASLLPSSHAGAETPQPAGREPSSIAKAICRPKAANLIHDVVGEAARISTPTWRNHLYSCDYRYAGGTMVLSVKELSSWSQTYRYFDGLGRSMHKTIPILQLGQGAFRVRDGSIVVRKDWKVLLVNVAGLPRQFGNPATSVEGVALSVAGVILDCWHGD